MESAEEIFLLSMPITSVSLDAIEDLVGQGRLKLPLDLRETRDLSVVHPLEAVPR